jgi:uncharacterized membrane protein
MSIIYGFLICGFLGWLAELSLKSVEARRLATDQMHWRLPFLPIYGFGAVYLSLIQPVTQNQPLLFQGLIFALALSALEFFGGAATELIFKKKFWDYSKTRYNIHGLVNLEHFVYWFALGIVFDQLIYPSGLNAGLFPQ